MARAKTIHRRGGEVFLVAMLAWGAAGCGEGGAPEVPPGPSVRPIDCVSRNVAGRTASGRSRHPALSWDGRFVAFESEAPDLVAGDGNDACDVFVRDRATGRIELVSRSSTGVVGNKGSHYASISWDGRFVAFHSYASNLVAGDGNGCLDIFLHDRETGRTERISEAPDRSDADGPSWNPQIAGGGRFVVFESTANDLVAGDGNRGSDVFRYDRMKSLTEIVSVAADKGDANGHSFWPSISADGDAVVFQSQATNLLPDLPPPRKAKDPRSVDEAGLKGPRTDLRIKAEEIRRRWKAENAERRPADTNRCRDVFLFTMSLGKTERMSVSSGGAQANAHCYLPQVSGDGKTVAFTSDASTLDRLGGNGHVHPFCRDRKTGRLERLDLTPEGTLADGRAYYVALAAYGRWVVFDSEATNLVPGDGNGQGDVFVLDRLRRRIARVSVPPGGGEADGASKCVAISPDGSVIAFHSAATNLVPGDGNGAKDVFCVANPLHEVSGVSPAP